MGEQRVGSWRDAETPARDELVDVLFRRHYTALLRLGVVMLGSREAAEDVVQDAFVALHRHRRALRNCAPTQDERWVMEQVLPVSPPLAGLVFSTESGWLPLVGKSALYGVWLAERGGYVLEIDPGGTYYVADDSGDPVDRGRWSLRGGSDLTLTSSAGSTECSKGDRLVLGSVEQVSPGTGTRGLRSTVQENTCGAAWTPAAWILIPHDGS